MNPHNTDMMREYLTLVHRPTLTDIELRRAVALGTTLGRSVMRDRRTIGVVRQGETHINKLPKLMREMRRTRQRIAEQRGLEGSIVAAIRGVQHCRNEVEALKSEAGDLFPVE